MDSRYRLIATNRAFAGCLLLSVAKRRMIPLWWHGATRVWMP
jgi:hypothetical protein